MKKFFVMILLVSTFFIGLGSLVDRAKANLKSDDRALELIKLSRAAIGGEANINNVRSLTIAGNSTHFFDREGLQQSDQGTLEINLQLPNQFSKMVRIGNPETAAEKGEIQKNVEVIVMNNDNAETKTTNTDGSGKNVFIVKNVDGKVLTEDIKSGDGQRTIVIKKDDGTVRQVTSDGNGAVWNIEEGKNISVKRDFKIEKIPGNRNNEMLRTTMALLLTAPQGTDVSYTFAGEGNVDGYSCNIIEVLSGGSNFKLFLDKSNYLPRMISFVGMDLSNVIKINKPISGEPQQNVKVMVKTSDDGANVEHQIKFADYRTVGGILLPYRWIETVNGKQSQNLDITNYEINPANIGEKFKDQKVFVRSVKPL